MIPSADGYQRFYTDYLTPNGAILLYITVSQHTVVMLQLLSSVKHGPTSETHVAASGAHCKGHSCRYHSPALQPRQPKANPCGAAQALEGDNSLGDTGQAEPSQPQTAAVTSPTQPWPLRAGAQGPHRVSIP